MNEKSRPESIKQTPHPWKYRNIIIDQDTASLFWEAPPVQRGQFWRPISSTVYDKDKKDNQNVNKT
jgi:hypothetical protein